jgi:hypothetical protein
LLISGGEDQGVDSASTSSTSSEDETSEDSSDDIPQLEDSWTTYPTASSAKLVDDWIRENGIVYDSESDADLEDEQTGEKPNDDDEQTGEEPNDDDEQTGEEPNDDDELEVDNEEWTEDQPDEDQGETDSLTGDVQEAQEEENTDYDELESASVTSSQHHDAVPSSSLLDASPLTDFQTPLVSGSHSSEEARPTFSSDTKSHHLATEDSSEETTTTDQTTEDTEADSPEDDPAAEDTPWTPTDYRNLDRVIQKLKKQLDPLNYSDFGFTLSHGHQMLDFSNSVRKCIATTGTFGHETDRLYQWLNTMMMEAAEGPHRLEFQLIKYAHLDKLVENIVEFKSRPPTLPFEELKMVEMACDLLRYWRDRFKDSYFLLDRQRQKVVMDDLLRGLIFEAPTPDNPSGWLSVEDRFMSERDAENAFHEGQ